MTKANYIMVYYSDNKTAVAGNTLQADNTRIGMANWHSKPLYPLRGFDLVTITPVIFGKLHVVVNDELVNSRDHIEISLSWDIIGLKHGDNFRHNLKKVDGSKMLKSRDYFCLFTSLLVSVEWPK